MFFNKEYGLLGTFQLPLAVFAIFMLITSFGLLSFRILNNIYLFFLDVFNLQFSVFKLFNLPTFRSFLNIDYRLMFPVFLAIALVLYFLFKAHTELKERKKYPVVFPFYLLYYSLIIAVCWITAIFKESTGAKKRWR